MEDRRQVPGHLDQKRTCSVCRPTHRSQGPKIVLLRLGPIGTLRRYVAYYTRKQDFASMPLSVYSANGKI